MSALDKIMDKENPNFIDTAIVYTAGKAWSLAQEAAEELAQLRYELAIKDAEVKRVDAENAELRRRLELAEAKEYE